MNKREFATAISNRNGISQKDAMERLNQVIEIIKEQLINHEEVKIRGFGTFKAVWRDEREMKNPNTKEQTIISERYIPVFIPGEGLRESVRGEED